MAVGALRVPERKRVVPSYGTPRMTNSASSKVELARANESLRAMIIRLDHTLVILRRSMAIMYMISSPAVS